MIPIIYIIFAALMAWIAYKTYRNQVDLEDRLILIIQAVISLCFLTVAILAYFRVNIFTI